MKSMLTQTMPMQTLSTVQLHVNALAVFVLAEGYTGGGGSYVSGKDEKFQGLDHIPLSAFMQSWMKHSAYLFSQGGCVEQCFFTSRQLKAAQSVAVVVLDWQMNRTTADRFLEVFMSKNMLDTGYGPE